MIKLVSAMIDLQQKTDQISRLTHTIEQSFQNKEKYGLVLIDLTAAYNTVCYKGLYLNMLKLIPDLRP